MSSLRIFPMIAAIAATITVAAMASPSARADIFCLDQTGTCDRCPVCDHVCEFKAERKDVDRDAFDVESKVICIPRVMFPWQKPKKRCGTACTGPTCSQCNNGARLRRVCVLKADSYSCPECHYSWEAKKKERVPCQTCATPSYDTVPMPPLESYSAPQEEMVPENSNWSSMTEYPSAAQESVDEVSEPETVPEFAPVFVEPTK